MARKPKFDYDLIVIGSGAAGSTAALAAVHGDKKVALIDGDTFGGESANWGDVPTKAVLEVTNLFHDAKQGSRFGLRSSTLGYNYPAILEWREKAIKRSGSADNRKFYEKAGLATYPGTAHFLTPHEISVNRTHLTASHFIIATGSHFATPDIYGIETIKYQTLRTIFSTKRLPRSLVIVGSSSEAIEHAVILATLGTKVYLIEKSAHLMPAEDEEVGELLARVLHDTRGITILTQTQVTEVAGRGLGSRVTYTRGTTSRVIQADEILFTDNRASSVDLGLENASVDYTGAGIRVDEHMRTSAQHIYAAGAVVSSTENTQVAMLQGRVAAHNLWAKLPLEADTALVPRTTFITPQVAAVGLNELACIKRDLAIRKVVVPLSQVPRSNTSDFTNGFVKLITDQKGIILGATIVAPDAIEMIHEVSLAIQQGLGAADLATLPHAFLSWSEAVRVAASRLV